MEKFSYLSNASPEYIDELFEKYLNDPDSVDSSWRYFFDGLELGQEMGQGMGKTVLAHSGSNGGSNGSNGGAALQLPAKGTTPVTSVDLSSEAKVADLINAYRERGRLIANLDPLSDPPSSHPLLELSNFKLTDADLNRTFTAGRLIGLGSAKLSEIIARLRQIYCSSVAIEYTHIQDPVAREWIQNKLESSPNEALTSDTQKLILRRLVESESFERFIHTRYVAQKRFSIEGGEGLIPALDRMIEIGADLGARDIVMGMAHRGRLNVLANIYGKKPEFIFTEFEDNYSSDESGSGEGDVKYHKGFSADIVTSNGHSVHLSLAHNPSHLEFVNPVVEGIARAKQRDFGDKERGQVIPVLIHGDAAFAGQGIVQETLNLSQLRGYWTGGTIHIVIDNQVGFTTDPIDHRSTTYSTDVAKMLEVPIFHVNGDDPEAIWYVAKLSTEYRQKFKKDVIIDLICYRKYGHNESDEPSFTQPLLYKKIKAHPTPREVYANYLVKSKVVTEDEVKGLLDHEMKKLTLAQQTTRTEKPRPYSSSYGNKWKGLRPAAEADMFAKIDTAIPEAEIKALADIIYKDPSGFKVHPKLKRVLEQRHATVQQGQKIDWGTGETLAYATLVKEGYPIRLSGQDVERGTFSHRHAVLHDFETGETHVPLNHIADQQGDFIIQNSMLSEQGVLGFEYGWSLADPNVLVIWEAQFGDFANGAQVIIDQFIASSESKWNRASGIVLLLPHGYEGQGPEHSSARLERFLQLCGKNNLAVCNFTTPAQVFHSLRRHIKRDFRKPMVVMTPKSLLRRPEAVSSISDFTHGGFQEVLDDPKFTQNGAATQVKKVLLCSGKIYYELAAEREASNSTDTAIVRLEQLYPWPEDLLEATLKRYPNAENYIWVQEEPRNMGAWFYVFAQWCGGYDLFQTRVGGKPIHYIGRDMGAAPAVGSHKRHVRVQKEIVEKAIKS